MRFFSGIRTDKKKNSASAMFKQKMSGKPQAEKTADEKYKEMMEAKVQKMMEDAIMGRKKAAPRIPGTRKEEDGPPKELSKNAKIMLQMLAMKKIKKDQKEEKKRAMRELAKAKAIKKGIALQNAAKDAQEKAAKDAQAAYEKQQADAAAAAAKASESWW